MNEMDPNMMMSFEEQQRRKQEQMMFLQQEKEKNAQMFRKLAPASIVYALVYTVCVYKNISGITVPVWIAATIGYVCYIVGRLDRKLKKDSAFYMIMMLLLGISTFLTGNRYIIWLNYAAFFLLLICFVLHNLKEDGDWDFIAYVSETAVAVGGAVNSIAQPFVDANAYVLTRNKKENGKTKYVLLGICIAVPLTLFLGVILVTADMVFADMIGNLFDMFLFPVHIFGVLFMLCFGFFSAYCGIRYVAAHPQNVLRTREKKGEPVIAITVTLAVALLYLVFCAIQILYLFVGHMELPDGITYAEYARTGFFQLLFVCILNLLLVLGIKRFFRQSRILDIILLVISFCTLIMTASSARRMLLYIEAYHLTFLRVAVLVSLFAIVLLMIGVMASILRPSFPLFGYGFAVVGVIYLVFSFAHVDYFIADYNLTQVQSDGTTRDYGYISRLSTDAAPAIAAYVQEHPDAGDEEVNGEFNWVERYKKRAGAEYDDMTLRSFNVSHYMAYRLLERADR